MLEARSWQQSATADVSETFSIVLVAVYFSLRFFACFIVCYDVVHPRLPPMHRQSSDYDNRTTQCQPKTAHNPKSDVWQLNREVTKTTDTGLP